MPAWRAWARVAAAWLAGLCTVQAGAANHALLIGVSDYPGLPAELRLKAPANDVRLMRQALLLRGFERAQIDVLADGVEGAAPPTRAAILGALGELAQRARRGDVYYLHFSGHGSLQPADGQAGRAPPATRMQPVFLPRDAGDWDGSGRQRIANAITDVELRTAIDRLNDAGAFVFAVFDACASARLVRGALPGTDAAQLRARHVPPRALGLGDALADEAWPQWLAPAAFPPGAATRGHAVYLYAAQSHEKALAVPFGGDAASAWNGVLTWQLARALASGRPMTYRQLGQYILDAYDQMAVANATPLLAGDGLDEPVFGSAAPPIRQWSLELQQGRLLLPAGALAGLAPGAMLAWLADPLTPASATPGAALGGVLGYLRVGEVAADHAWLQPVAWRGLALPTVPPAPPHGWGRLVSSPPSFALRVQAVAGACPAPCPMAAALSRLQRDGVPGVDVTWVIAPEPADVRLVRDQAGLRFLPSGAAEDAAVALGLPWPRADDATALASFTQQVAEVLHRLARSRNLLRLAAGLALSQPQAGLDIVLKTGARGGEASAKVARERLTPLHAGDPMVLELRNTGRDPVDVNAFWIGGDQQVQRIYPEDSRDSTRLAGSASLPPLKWHHDGLSEGLERLVVFSAPMRPGKEPLDLRFLEQSPLSRLRGASDPELQALFDACFADYRSRGEAAPAPAPELLHAVVYSFQVSQ